MNWDDLLPLAVFFVALIASIMSGMTGGGGSFILTPFYILIGLTPQQAVATGKFGGFGMSLGAVAAFRERMLQNKRLSLFVMVLAAIIGVIASLLLQEINNSILQLLIGFMMLAMVPFMIFKARKVLRKNASSVEKVIGISLLALVLLLQGLLSSGVGSLISAIFIIFFGMSALEANIMKRKTSLLITGVMTLLLLGSGLINFKYGFAGMAGGLFGGYIGSRIALKKGESFARYAMLMFMTVSGVWLVATA